MPVMTADPTAASGTDVPEPVAIPPSTAPDHFNIACRGFAEEDVARKIGTAVGEWVRGFGHRFDLSRLDGVTVAFDYPQALAELDRGYETTFRLTPSDGNAIGVAMTPSVMRDGVIKSHIVLNAGYVMGIESPEHPSHQFAIHLIAHECAHVEITQKFDAAFPGRLLRPVVADIWERARAEVSSAVWDEFAATCLSAPFGEDPTDGYEETFITSLEAARTNANNAIIAYRTRDGLDQVVADVYGTYGNLLKFAAYHLGNLAGRDVVWKDRPRTTAALDGHWFEPYFERLDKACKDVAEGYGRWTSLDAFSPIADIADEIVAAGGLHFSRDDRGRVRVDIPFTYETMPEGWEPDDGA
jgi:hypothetical protein